MLDIAELPDLIHTLWPTGTGLIRDITKPLPSLLFNVPLIKNIIIDQWNDFKVQFLYTTSLFTKWWLTTIMVRLSQH